MSFTLPPEYKKTSAFPVPLEPFDLKEALSRTEIVSRKAFPLFSLFHQNDKWVWKVFKGYPVSPHSLPSIMRATQSSVLKNLYRLELAKFYLLQNCVNDAKIHINCSPGTLIERLMLAVFFELSCAFESAYDTYAAIELKEVPASWKPIVLGAAERVRQWHQQSMTSK